MLRASALILAVAALFLGGGSVGIEPPPHGWAQSAYHEQSEVCGSCHNVSTPITSAGPLKTLILDDGTPTRIPYPSSALSASGSRAITPT